LTNKKRTLLSYSWYLQVPGLINEIELLAWGLRTQNPYFLGSTSETDVNGSSITIQTMPRNFWEIDPRFLNLFPGSKRETLRARDIFRESSGSSSAKYMCEFRLKRPGKYGSITARTHVFDTNGPVRAVESMELLTAATSPVDLADEFAWFESAARLPAHVRLLKQTQ